MEGKIAVVTGVVAGMDFSNQALEPERKK